MAEFVKEAFEWVANPVAKGNQLAIDLARKEAEKKLQQETQTRQDQTQALQDSIKEKMANEPKEEAAAAVEARKKQKGKTAGALGRRSTILTSPLGIQGGEQSGTKTLLGA